MAPSIAEESPAPIVKPQKSSSIHPFAPLSAAEIKNVASILTKSWPAGTDLQFRVITLSEPKKAEMMPFIVAENKGETYSSPPARKAFVVYYIRNTSKLHEAVVDLSEQKVEYNVRKGANVHANIDGPTIIGVEKIAMEDPGVQDAIKQLQLPEGSVVVIDPWIYGSDGVNDDEYLIQCFMYMRSPDNSTDADSNHYAHPLPISPVVHVETGKVIRIDRLPTGAGLEQRELGPWPVKEANEYVPEKQNLRTDLKPLHIVQPEGASFSVAEQGTSKTIEWQKWSFRVGFNQREGMVLYNVKYDGRSLFYRLSLSDMNIRKTILAATVR
jgi:primary-amine oxidase